MSLFGAADANAAIARPIDVVSINWPGAPALETNLEQLRSVVNNYTIGYWQRQANIEFSDGITDFNQIKMNTEAPCNGDATVTYMSQIAAKFYSLHNLDPHQRYLFVLMPKLTGDCVWAAKSFVGDFHTPYGMTILQDSIQPNVITHELGHSLGLGHTNLMTCPSAPDGDWGNCQNNEYQGAIDMMSNLNIQGPLNIYDKWRIHAVDELFIKSVKTTGDYNLYPTNLDADTQGLYIRDGRAVYWIEFRLAIDGYAKGLAIYRSDTPANSTKVISPNSEYTGKYASEQSGDIWLLNLNNFEYSDTPMGSPTGWDFKNYTGNIKISAVDRGPYAQVHVEIKPGTTVGDLPINPTDLSRYTFTEKDLGTGFVVSNVVNGNTLVDPTLQICNGKFNSELHRQSRNQVVANPPSPTSSTYKKYSFISSEAVEYESKQWASNTLTEIDSVIKKCSDKNSTVKKLTYLSPNNIKARSILVVTKSKTATQYLYATFQVKNNIMIGTYVISNSALKTSETNKWMQVSQKLGTKL